MMKQAGKRFLAALVSLAIPLLVSPVTPSLITSPAWAESEHSSGLTVTPTSLSFTYQQGGTVPASQKLSVSSIRQVSFTDSTSGTAWLVASPSSGYTPGTITVSVKPGTLAAATYQSSVVISSKAGNVTVPVTLTVTSSTSGSGGGSGGGGTSSSGYVLTAWSELGMHCMDGKDYSVASVLPPYNTLYAKLLTKGSQPTPVTSGVTVTYLAMKDASGSINTTSYGTSTIAQKTNFWTYVRTLFLGQPAPDVGLHNYAVQSLTPQAMTYDSTKGLWKAEGIPTAPYDDTGASKPYPMVQIVAKNSSGQTIATATAVLNVSDEMTCSACHSPANNNTAAMPAGGWVSTGSTTAQTVKYNILKKHDDRWSTSITAAMLSELQTKGYTYQSSLYQTAASGTPVLCASCHLSNALNAAGMNTGVSGANPLTQDMHTLHASQTYNGTTLDNATSPNGSCYLCHPGLNTKCVRGAMSGTTAAGSTSVACFSCHGNLSRVGMANRTGWLDEPNCQMCHQNGTVYTSTFTSSNIGPTGTQRTSSDTRFATSPNAPSTGFSLYRFSQGHGGTECSACHGAQHAEYPSNQPNDNVYPVNLQGYAARLTECNVCHSTALSVTNNGGPHGMHTVGQAWVSSHPQYAQGGGYTACAYCHGSDYRGTSLSQLYTSKTFSAGDYGTKTFSAGHQMNCYDCHNGPTGG